MRFRGPRGFTGAPPAAPSPAQHEAPHRKESTGGGLRQEVRSVGKRCYFFFPWFLTASIAAAAASGSRYVPPGFTGLKDASNS